MGERSRVGLVRITHLLVGADGSVPSDISYMALLAIRCVRYEILMFELVLWRPLAVCPPQHGDSDLGHLLLIDP